MKGLSALNSEAFSIFDDGPDLVRGKEKNSTLFGGLVQKKGKKKLSGNTRKGRKSGKQRVQNDLVLNGISEGGLGDAGDRKSEPWYNNVYFSENVVEENKNHLWTRAEYTSKDEQTEKVPFPKQKILKFDL